MRREKHFKESLRISASLCASAVKRLPRANDSAIIRAVRPKLPLLVLFLAACAAPLPPVTAPSTPPPPPAVESDRVLETVRVNASALNVRELPTTDAAILGRVKRGAPLSVLSGDAREGWLRVRTADGETGWVSERFVSRGSGKGSTSTARRRGGCPPDSDFAFLETPTLAFSENPKPGMVVVEASINTKGDVTGTKVITNTTGDETLAFLTEREIRQAKFAPPIRNCVPRAFIFTYKRTF